MSPASRRVAESVFGDVRISTVEIPLHRGIGLLPYETMVFGGDHDQCCWRDATESEAVARHAEVVEFIKMWPQPSK